MFTIKRNGATRNVILTKNYAIKIPTFNSWKDFCSGIVANLTEWDFRTMADNPNCCLCPQVWGSKTGLVLIMRRCTPVKNRGLYFVELERIVSLSPSVTKIAPTFYTRDAKPENFGYYKGRMVLLDYGS